MSVIELEGQVGPVEALALRVRLDQETAEIRPRVVVDLSRVDTIHPAVVAAVVRATRRARRVSGDIQLIAPAHGPAARVLDLISASDVLR